jgi:hypothetical protein
VGNAVLVFGRVGYVFLRAAARRFEAGLLVRTPLGDPFREWPHEVPDPSRTRGETSCDLGGEELVRLISLYLTMAF